MSSYNENIHQILSKKRTTEHHTKTGYSPALSKPKKSGNTIVNQPLTPLASSSSPTVSLAPKNSSFSSLSTGTTINAIYKKNLSKGSNENHSTQFWKLFDQIAKEKYYHHDTSDDCVLTVLNALTLANDIVKSIGGGDNMKTSVCSPTNIIDRLQSTNGSFNKVIRSAGGISKFISTF